MAISKHHQGQSGIKGYRSLPKTFKFNNLKDWQTMANKTPMTPGCPLLLKVTDQKRCL